MDITSSIINRVCETIDKYKMIDNGDGIVVGISGGPDSVCLLHALSSSVQRYKIKLYAAHVNHMLRGKESDEDILYVKSICEKLEVELYIKNINIKDISQKYKISLEAAGRQERYKFFFEVLKNTGASKIAVAHNMNDQAETMLMRFIRGTGLEGLSGIKPVREDGIIRPLIETERIQIEEYCIANKLNPRLDKSNLEPIFTRNKIRLELIPHILKEYNPKFIKNMAVMADNFRNDNEYLDYILKEKENEILNYSEDSVSLNIDRLLAQHPSKQSRIIRRAIGKLLGSTTDIESKHISEIRKIITKGTTALKVDLPRNTQAEVEYNVLLIKKKVAQNITYEYPVILNQSIYIKEINASVYAFTISPSELNTISLEQGIAVFDYDKTKENIYIRSRRPGDKFTPPGMEGTKKVKDFFIDNKIPRAEREKIPILASTDSVLWVVGYRINDKYKYTDSSKRILVVRYSKGG